MKIPFVKRIKQNLRSAYFKNINSLVERSENAVVDNDGRITYFAVFNTGSPSIYNRVLSIIRVGDKVFYYTVDKKLYYINGESLIVPNLNKFTYAPTIVEIMQNGVLVPFVIDGNGNGYVIDQAGIITSYQIPCGRVAVVYNGMLLIANGNEVYFSAPLDYTDFTMDLNRGGVVRTDKNDGEICSMVVQDNKLIILTKHAVYTFTAFGDRIDYTLKKVETSIPEIRMFSAKDCGDKTIFISGGKLCSYSNEKITPIKSVLDVGDHVVVGNSAVDKGVYYVPVADAQGKYKVLRYDVKSGLQCLINMENELIADGGYSVSNDGRGLYIIENLLAPGGVCFVSKPLDFGTAKKKVLHEVSLSCESSGTLTVKGDNEERKFELKNGGNVKRMNVTSKSFRLIFSGNAVFNMDNVTIKYRIKGE